MSDPVTRRVTHIDGVEVVATEQAVATSPHYRNDPTRPYNPQGVTKALLVDGTEEHLCNDCDYHAVKVDSVIAHRNGTHDRRVPHAPLTPKETIKAVLRAVAEARQQGGRDYVARAAAALNTAGVINSHGKAWSAGAVSGIYLAYKDNPEYRVRVRAARPNGTRIAIPAQASAPPAPVGPVGVRLAAVADILRELAAELADLAVQIQIPAVDPALADKAAKYDQLRALLP